MTFLGSGPTVWPLRLLDPVPLMGVLLKKSGTWQRAKCTGLCTVYSVPDGYSGIFFLSKLTPDGSYAALQNSPSDKVRAGAGAWRLVGSCHCE